MSNLSVAIVVPVLNEEQHLADVYEAIKNQTYHKIVSIVFALGPSTDGTHSIAKALARQDSRIRLVDNPSGKTPTAMNLGIQQSDSDIVVRCDGHALLPPTYVADCVRLLVEKNAVNVGGRMLAEGNDDFTRAVAWAMTSKWGVGKAAFHVGGEAGASDTVYLGAFRRDALKQVGGYDESMVRAQDWELNYRLRKNGGLIWFDPQLKVTYRPRNSIQSLASQYFQYGQWRRRVMRMYPETVPQGFRYLAPPLLVIALLLSLILPQIGYFANIPLLMLSAFVPMLYMITVALIVLVAVMRREIAVQSALILFFVIMTMHVSWGSGFLLSRK